MKTAIIYCSKHGTVEKVARLISQKMNEEVELIDLEKDPSPSLNKYERIILGGSIYGGSIQKRLQNFCHSNRDELLKKEIGLFICCMSEDPAKMQEEFDNAFPQALRDHSRSNGFMGGELIMEKLGFMERLIVRMVAKTKTSMSKINYKAIDQFVSDLKAQHAGV